MQEEASVELIQSDCVEGMRRLADGSVHLVMTSPPYNLGIDYNDFHDAKPTAEYLDWTRQWTNEVRRVLHEDGSFFLNVGSSPSNPLLPHQVALLLAESFVLQNTFHWIKSITVKTPDGEPISVGHFKPINSERFVNDFHEFVFHFTKTGKVRLNRLAVGVPYADKSNITRWGHTHGQDVRCRGNTWFVPYQTIRDRVQQRPHPATFPVALAELCIRLHGRAETMTMLDPFVGIGHAALAARKCGVRKFIGFDLDAEYLSIARQAVDEAEFSELPLFKPLPSETSGGRK